VPKNIHIDRYSWFQRCCWFQRCSVFKPIMGWWSDIHMVRIETTKHISFRNFVVDPDPRNLGGRTDSGWFHTIFGTCWACLLDGHRWTMLASRWWIWQNPCKWSFESEHHWTKWCFFQQVNFAYQAYQRVTEKHEYRILIQTSWKFVFTSCSML